MTVSDDDLPDGATADLLMVAELARHGNWWEAGGLGDQSRWLVDGVRQVWADEALMTSATKAR